MVALRQRLLFDDADESHPLTAAETIYVIRYGVRAALRRGLPGDVGHDAAVNGLLRAVRRYRAGRGAAFTTLACSGLHYRLADAAKAHAGSEDALTHAVHAGVDPSRLDGGWVDRPWFTDELDVA